MDSRGQTSVEFLILVSGIVLIVLVIGYYLVSSATQIQQEVNRVSRG